MERSAYINTQVKLLEVCQQVKQMDLTGFIDAISAAEPLVNPGLYQRGIKPLSGIKRVAQNLILVQEAYAELEKGMRK